MLTQQDRVTKSHIAIMRSKEFCMFSGVLSIGSLQFTDKIPTACTNGRDVMYNPEFIETLSDKELNFVVLHEAIHKAYQHLNMWKKLFKEDAQLTNMAADYVVNNAIQEADPHNNLTSMPESALFDKQYSNMTTKQIFDLLKEQGADREEGHDTHDFAGAEELSQEEVKATAEQIDQALRQGEILRSKMGGNTNRAFQELRAPKVDWREQLREFVSTICNNKEVSTWKRPHRRFIGQDVYMPSMTGESVGKIVIGVDTSGSIGDTELNMFLSEVQGICKEVKPSSVELVYWTHQIDAHETYDRHELDSLVDSTKPSGGGGTTVGCLNQYIQDERLEPEAVVILTDGYVETDWGGAWQHPTLWAITTKGMQSPHGKSIYLDTEV